MKRAIALVTLPWILFACGGEETAPPTGLLAPPPAGQGVQLTMTTTIEPGSEVEHCRFVKAPPEGIALNRDEVRYSRGSHHFLLYETPYEEIPTVAEDGEVVDTSGVFDCTEGVPVKWQLTRLLGGSQNATGTSMVEFPPHVAMHVPGNAVLLMNAHYINPTPEPLEVEVAVNLWSVPEAQIEAEGDVLFWYNLFIKVPPQGKARAQMRCDVPEDITLTGAQSHMHARGVGYVAQVMGQTPFYENDRWENVPVGRFEGGLSAAAGSTIEYWCDYDNPEMREVFQGPRSTDEMCMFIAPYYPAVPGLGRCSSDASDPHGTKQLGPDWVGQGEASCAETLACVQDPGDEAFLQHVQRCVTDSDPSVSREVSDGIRCLLLSIMNGDSPAEACADEISTCMAK